MGADPLVPWENDKPTVLALREIAENLEPAEPKSDEEALMDAFSNDEAAGEEAEQLASGAEAGPGNEQES
jgi:DNA-directed RNA polymerase subunit omega